MTGWASWLTEHLRREGWTPAELSRQSGRRGVGDPRPVIPTDVISRWITGKTRRPSYDTVLAVAALLKASEEEALRAAGYELPGQLPSLTQSATGTVGPPPDTAQPVGLGLDSEAADLTPEQIESVRAVIRAMKPPNS
jgi:transcriptional regulator with XRE-family HTH domain